MSEKKFFLFFLIFAFGMCGSTSSIEVNEPTEDIEVNLNNTEAIEKAEETAQTDTNSKSDLVSKESQAVTIENIKPIDHFGTSSHMEIVDDSTLRLFYNDFGGVVVFLCSYDFDCETQGTIRFITDLTLIETLDGERRGYFVEMNPNTMESGIYTAIFSEDGLSFTEKTPLGITAREDEVAWGVPDTVVMPNGLIRVYWVYTEDNFSPEKIVSATSKTTKGIEFTLDPGYRIDDGYVDFEVLKAEEGDWRAVMSYTPHYLPDIPQSLFYATSKDGLDWEFSKKRITEKDFSYLDPTGVPLDNGTYLLIMSGATNEMADPMKNPTYQLFTAQLTLP
mgnify:FL=1|tara:strand:+ start:1332 stop:2336 length:1005 start_codon:yes stop_codon:yes gene_type:complete